MSRPISQQTHRIGKAVDAYAGYLNCGLSDEDAQLALTRFAGEYPGHFIIRHPLANGKYQAVVYEAIKLTLMERSALHWQAFREGLAELRYRLQWGKP